MLEERLQSCDSYSWKAPKGILSGEREREHNIPQQIDDFVTHHRNETEVTGVMSLPLPEKFFNESCYPEYDFVEVWIYEEKALFNAYLCILRTCGEMLMKHIVASPKDPTLFKYFTDCQAQKNKILQTKKQSVGDYKDKKTGKDLEEEFLGAK